MGGPGPPNTGSLVQFLRINSDTKRSLDSLSEGLGVPEDEDTAVVNLGFDEG